jgi:hypothetical protein
VRLFVIMFMPAHQISDGAFALRALSFLICSTFALQCLLGLDFRLLPEMKTTFMRARLFISPASLFWRREK